MTTHLAFNPQLATNHSQPVLYDTWAKEAQK